MASHCTIIPVPYFVLRNLEKLHLETPYLIQGASRPRRCELRDGFLRITSSSVRVRYKPETRNHTIRRSGYALCSHESLKIEELAAVS